MIVHNKVPNLVGFARMWPFGNTAMTRCGPAAVRHQVWRPASCGARYLLTNISM